MHLKEFDPEKYRNRIFDTASFIKERVSQEFSPRVSIVMGSGGLGEIANLFENTTILPYDQIPGFTKTTVDGHVGNLVLGYISGVPVAGFAGRKHFYEKGAQPNEVIALKELTFPVYVAAALGAEIYFSTNAAGGLNPRLKTGDLMVIRSHIDLFFPNPLGGPQVDFMNAPRFQGQDRQYDNGLRGLLVQAAINISETDHVHEGVYVALTGPTYESSADSQALRSLGADAVGMSVVPDVIVAANLGLATLAFSLITNVVATDGTNATSHEEVSKVLANPATKKRVTGITTEFFKLLGAGNEAFSTK